MTPQELKNSILQLAIQGKLVEQRAEEGTAEELYEQIQQEKQRLIAEKKIKKEKPLPEITEDEKPFDIPDSWKWVRIGECGSWGSGATPSRTNPEYYGGSIPWLKTGDLNDGIVANIPEYITELALEKTSVRLNPIGSVLMAMYGATIGKLAILGIEATTNQACCACIPYSGIYNKYLFYFLMGSRTSFIKMGEGGAQPNISKEKIVNALISLPPLAEQKRIVEKIEQILPYIDQYEKAWGKLETFNKRFPDDMKKSLLQYAIEGKLVEQRPEEGTAEELYQQIQQEKQRLIAEKKIKKEKPLPEITEDEIPFDIPDSWKWVRIGNIFNVGTGMTPLKSEEKFYNDGTIPWVTSSLTSQRFIKMAETNITKYALEKTSLTIYPAHTLIVAMYGQGKTRGQVSELLINATINQACAALGNIINNQVFISYIYFCFLFNYELLRKKAEGTSQPNLNLNKIKEMLIPLPPLAEQKRIVEKLEQMLPLCERLK